MEIRAAKRSDSADLAILDDIASRGFACWLWQGAITNGAPASTAHEFGRQKLAGDKGAISWRNASLAVDGEDTAGMVLGYPLPHDIALAADLDPVLLPLAKLQQRVAASWYIDALAVYSRFRGSGAGRMLLRHECGKASGSPVSLITEDDNHLAQALYTSEGFAEIARAECIPFSPSQTNREWVLFLRGGEQ